MRAQFLPKNGRHGWASSSGVYVGAARAPARDRNQGVLSNNGRAYLPRKKHIHNPGSNYRRQQLHQDCPLPWSDETTNVQPRLVGCKGNQVCLVQVIMVKERVPWDVSVGHGLCKTRCTQKDDNAIRCGYMACMITCWRWNEDRSISSGTNLSSCVAVIERGRDSKRVRHACGHERATVLLRIQVQYQAQ